MLRRLANLDAVNWLYQALLMEVNLSQDILSSLEQSAPSATMTPIINYVSSVCGRSVVQTNISVYVRDPGDTSRLRLYLSPDRVVVPIWPISLSTEPNAHKSYSCVMQQVESLDPWDQPLPPGVPEPVLPPVPNLPPDQQPVHLPGGKLSWTEIKVIGWPNHPGRLVDGDVFAVHHPGKKLPTLYPVNPYFLNRASRPYGQNAYEVSRRLLNYPIENNDKFELIISYGADRRPIDEYTREMNLPAHINQVIVVEMDLGPQPRPIRPIVMYRPDLDPNREGQQWSIVRGQPYQFPDRPIDGTSDETSLFDEDVED